MRVVLARWLWILEDDRSAVEVAWVGVKGMKAGGRWWKAGKQVAARMNLNFQQLDGWVVVSNWQLRTKGVREELRNAWFRVGC